MLEQVDILTSNAQERSPHCKAYHSGQIAEEGVLNSISLSSLIAVFSGVLAALLNLFPPCLLLLGFLLAWRFI